ncbi:microtubule-associated 4 isoform X1 [Pelobates cultripes]|uniref:Microtubule-associated protein n=1 Tax=Pelobates cultripes TaxID=61616 RepID=A0AAD1RUL0_PELCU|nr:microtubule-associated 4 isoform X1 [Pelobates cultripes]
MADLEPNFSLEDALTDAPPQIEPEIKRDFISSLEAEPYDDVVGETCDKADYVPLLDDDETKEPGDGSQTSVLENGEHVGEGDAPNPFEPNQDEKAGSDILLLPCDNTSHHSFTEPFGEAELQHEAISRECLLDLTEPAQPADIDLLSKQPVAPGPNHTGFSQGAFDEEWLTGYPKAGDTDTPSDKNEDQGHAILCDASNDTLVKHPFQITEADPNSDIWQPTIAEQIALASHHSAEPVAVPDEVVLNLPEGPASVCDLTEVTGDSRFADSLHSEEMVLEDEGPTEPKQSAASALPVESAASTDVLSSTLHEQQPVAQNQEQPDVSATAPEYLAMETQIEGSEGTPEASDQPAEQLKADEAILEESKVPSNERLVTLIEDQVVTPLSIVDERSDAHIVSDDKTIEAAVSVTDIVQSDTAELCQGIQSDILEYPSEEIEPSLANPQRDQETEPDVTPQPPVDIKSAVPPPQLGQEIEYDVMPQIPMATESAVTPPQLGQEIEYDVTPQTSPGLESGVIEEPSEGIQSGVTEPYSEYIQSDLMEPNSEGIPSNITEPYSEGVQSEPLSPVGDESNTQQLGEIQAELPTPEMVPVVESALPLETSSETEQIKLQPPPSPQQVQAPIKSYYKTSDRRSGRPKTAAMPVSDAFAEPHLGNPNHTALESTDGLSNRAKALHKKAHDMMESRREVVKDGGDSECAQATMKKKKKKTRPKRGFSTKESEIVGEVVHLNTKPETRSYYVPPALAARVEEQKGFPQERGHSPTHDLAVGNFKISSDVSQVVEKGIKDAEIREDGGSILLSPKVLEPSTQNQFYPSGPFRPLPKRMEDEDRVHLESSVRLLDKNRKSETPQDAKIGFADTDITKCPYLQQELASSHFTEKAAKSERVSAEALWVLENTDLNIAEDLGYQEADAGKSQLAAKKMDKPKNRDKRTNEQTNAGLKLGPSKLQAGQMEMVFPEYGGFLAEKPVFLDNISVSDDQFSFISGEIPTDKGDRKGAISERKTKGKTNSNPSLVEPLQSDIYQCPAAKQESSPDTEVDKYKEIKGITLITSSSDVGSFPSVEEVKNIHHGLLVKLPDSESLHPPHNVEKREKLKKSVKGAKSLRSTLDDNPPEMSELELKESSPKYKISDTSLSRGQQGKLKKGKAKTECNSAACIENTAEPRASAGSIDLLLQNEVMNKHSEPETFIQEQILHLEDRTPESPVSERTGGGQKAELFIGDKDSLEKIFSYGQKGKNVNQDNSSKMMPTGNVDNGGDTQNIICPSGTVALAGPDGSSVQDAASASFKLELKETSQEVETPISNQTINIDKFSAPIVSVTERQYESFSYQKSKSSKVKIKSYSAQPVGMINADFKTEFQDISGSGNVYLGADVISKPAETSIATISTAESEPFKLGLEEHRVELEPSVIDEIATGKDARFLGDIGSPEETFSYLHKKKNKSIKGKAKTKSATPGNVVQKVDEEDQYSGCPLPILNREMELCSNSSELDATKIQESESLPLLLKYEQTRLKDKAPVFQPMFGADKKFALFEGGNQEPLADERSSQLKGKKGRPKVKQSSVGNTDGMIILGSDTGVKEVSISKLTETIVKKADRGSLKRQHSSEKQKKLLDDREVHSKDESKVIERIGLDGVLSPTHEPVRTPHTEKQEILLFPEEMSVKADFSSTPSEYVSDQLDTASKPEQCLLEQLSHDIDILTSNVLTKHQGVATTDTNRQIGQAEESKIEVSVPKASLKELQLAKEKNKFNDKQDCMLTDIQNITNTFETDIVKDLSEVIRSETNKDTDAMPKTVDSSLLPGKLHKARDVAVVNSVLFTEASTEVSKLVGKTTQTNSENVTKQPKDTVPLLGQEELGFVDQLSFFTFAVSSLLDEEREVASPVLHSEKMTDLQLEERSPAQGNKLNVEPSPAQGNKLNVEPSPAQGNKLNVEPSPAQGNKLNVEPSPAQGNKLNVEPSPAQGNKLNVEQSPAQGNKLNEEPSPAQGNKLNEEPSPAQGNKLNVEPSPAQGNKLNEEPSPAQGNKLNEEPSPAQGNKLNEEPSPAQGNKLNEEPSPAQGNKLNEEPSPAQGNKLNEEPSPAQGNKLNEEPSPAQGNKLNEEPSPAQGNKLNEEPSPAQGNKLNEEPSPAQGNKLNEVHEPKSVAAGGEELPEKSDLSTSEKTNFKEKIKPPVHKSKGQMAPTERNHLNRKTQMQTGIPPQTNHGNPEDKAKASAPLKGYMRPTKSRGMTPPPLKSAAVESEKSKPLKDVRLSTQKPDKGKPEIVETPPVTTANDITAPPNKELPASPEKKVKVSTTTLSSKSAAAKGKPSTGPSPKKPVSSTPTPKKPPSPALAQGSTSTPRRPLGSAGRPSSLTPKDSKDIKPKSPVKSPDKKPATTKPLTLSTPRSSVKASPATTKVTSSAPPADGTAATKPNGTPKRPVATKNDVKSTEFKKTTTTKSPTDLTRTKPVSADSAKINGAAPAGTTTVPTRPKPAAPKPSSAPAVTSDTKKLAPARSVPVSKPTTTTQNKSTTAAKPITAPKQSRPPSATAPDLKNIRSKIGSTDNLKHQPGGGKAKVEKKPVPASTTARKPVTLAGPKSTAPKPAVTKESVPKQSNEKVPNAAKPAAGSARPQAPSNHKPGSANVQIVNKKIDVSKVSSKCGSKANLKPKSGGGDSKTEASNGNSKKQEETMSAPKENNKDLKSPESESVSPPQNGHPATLTTSPSEEAQENGVGDLVSLEGGNPKENQSFNTLIPETSI